MSHRDALTGALSRSAFDLCLADAIDTANSTGRDFALLVIDIDNMKHFNAHNGHLAGDEMLKRFAALTSPLVGSPDFLFRIGGDEFAIILPESSRERCLHLAKQICEMARNQLAPPQPAHCGDRHCLGSAKVSTSIGVELFARNANAERLLQSVEAKLYDAKYSGKDRVCM